MGMLRKKSTRSSAWILEMIRRKLFCSKSSPTSSIYSNQNKRSILLTEKSLIEFFNKFYH
jgi:hypothetical protein